MKKIKNFITGFVVFLVMMFLVGCNDAESYHVTFIVNGGTQVADQYTSKIETEPVTSLTGYIFSGWYLTNDLSGERVEFPYELKQHTTMYAKWESAEEGYTVIFITNGGSSIQSMKTSMINTSPIATKDGSTFEGWYLTSDFSGEAISFPYAVTSDCALYAKWNTASQTYKVTFETNGGIAINAKQVSVIETSPETILSGSTFEGWYLTSDFSGEAITFPFTVTKDCTLYAKWKTEISEYTVTYNSNGGTAVPSFTGEVVSSSPETTKENGIFVGWYEDSEFQSKADFPYELYRDITLYAKWDRVEETNPDDIAQLDALVNASYGDNYKYVFKQKVNNTEEIVFIGASTYYCIGKNFICVSPATDSDGNYLFDSNGNYIYNHDYVFYHDEDKLYYCYFEDANGSYQYDNVYYTLEVTGNPYEEYFNTCYLSNLSKLDSSKFYKYDNKWYAISDYVNEAGKILYGDNDYVNQSDGYEMQSESFTTLCLTFTNGKLSQVYAESKMSYGKGTIASGVPLTYYDVVYTTEFSNFGEVGTFSEDVFSGDGELPSGMYPKLDDTDANRSAYVADGKIYTIDELKTAIGYLTNYTAYVTTLGNTYSGDYSQYQTINVNGTKGLVNYTGSSEPAYYFYDEANQASYFIYDNAVYCDKYSYKNLYEYNQYLLDAEASVSISQNFKIASACLYLLDANLFTFNANGYFEYSGSALNDYAKFIFGNGDYDRAPYSEFEVYDYLRIYLTNGKITRILATSKVQIYESASTSPDGNELFVKEIIIQDYNTTQVTLPSVLLYIPGDAKESGSIAGLESCFNYMGQNYKYADEFCFVDSDEIWGVYNGEKDTYITTGDKTKVGSSFYYYYKNGLPYAYYSNYSQEVEAENLEISWGLPILDQIDVNWFYEGVDGNYYCKKEFLNDCAKVLTRFSGSPYMLDGQSSYYRKEIILDYVQIITDGTRVSSIYYSGVMKTTGSQGSYNQLFSGRGVFTDAGSCSITLPSGIVADSAMPDKVLMNQEDALEPVVSDNGVLSFNELTTASSYVINVYKDNELVSGSPFTVTNGFNLKTILSIGTYSLEVIAKGDNVKYKDSKPSNKVEFEISKYIVLDTPTNGVVDRDTNTFTFDPVVGASKYYVMIVQDGTTVYSKEVTTPSVTLESCTNGVYEIQVYAMGDNVTYSDSRTLKVQYSVTDRLGEFFDIILNQSHHYKQSIQVKLNGDFLYEGNYEYWYDVTLNVGKAICKLYPSNNDVYNYSNPQRIVTIYYYVQDGIYKAKVVDANASGATTTNIYDGIKRPFLDMATMNTGLFTDGCTTSTVNYSLEVTGENTKPLQNVNPIALLFSVSDYSKMNFSITKYKSGCYSFSFTFISGDYTYKTYCQTTVELDKGKDFSSEVVEN